MSLADVPRRRPVAVVALGVLTVGVLLAGNSLVSCDAEPGAAPPRPTRAATAAEVKRLAGVRLADYRVGHVGVQATLGSGAAAVHLTGWVDWRRPLVYLNMVGPPGANGDGLLQAIPGVVAVREGRYTPPPDSTDAGAAFAPYPAPPVNAPPTGWRVRPTAPGSTIDTMLTLLFALRSSKLDDVRQLTSIGTQYVGTDQIGGVPVTVFDGAAVPPPASKKPAGPVEASVSPAGKRFAAQGGQVRYWVDAESHLLRAEALVDPTTTLRIDFDRADNTAPRAIELLGGAPVTPRKPTAAQLVALSRMRLRDYLTGGGTITVAIPLSADELVTGVGWLDWRKRALYLTVRNNRTDGPDSTLRADAHGVTVLDGDSRTWGTEERPTPESTDTRNPISMPTLHPATTGWTRSSWTSREDRYGEPDFDTLLRELLALASPKPDNRGALKLTASTLRTDKLNGIKVTVYEIRQPSEALTPPGFARLRYWIDGTGKLRRLELRTRGGAYGYVTVNPAPVPKLPNPVPA